MIKNKDVWMKKVEDCKLKIKNGCASVVDTCRTDPVKWAMFAWLMMVISAIMLFVIIGDRGKSLVDTLMLLSSMVFAGALVSHNRLPRSTEFILLLVYALWLTGTRVLLGDFSLTQSVERLSTAWFGAIVCFSVPFCFSSEQSRRKLRLTVANVTAGFGVICTLLSILIVVFNVNIKIGNVLDFSDWISIVDGRLYFIGHPNILAQILCVGVCSAIICAMEAKKKLTAVIYALSAFFMLLGIAMTDSRTSSVGACLVISAAAGLLVFKFMHGRIEKKPLFRMAQIAASILCFAVVFFGANECIKGQRAVLEEIGNSIRIAATEKNYEVPQTNEGEATVSDAGETADQMVDTSIGENTASDVDETVDTTVETATKSSANSTVTVEETDQLSFSERGYDDADEIMSMNGRMYIYEHALKTLKDNPKILLIGQLFDESPIVYPRPNGRNYTVMHWHNAFIEVVFEAGVVGLVLIVAFVVLMLIKMVKVFFGAFSDYSVSEKYTLSIPAVALIFSMLEPTLFSTYEQYIPKLIYMLFLVWCGIIVSGIKQGDKVKVSSIK